ELLRLQQILFYKELDFSLDDIRSLLEDPDFDLLRALAEQRRALQARQARLGVLLGTIDKTISQLKGERDMLTNEELYAGFPKGQGETYRQEIAAKYGDQVVEESEQKLRQLGKEGFAKLKAEQEDITRTLLAMLPQDPASAAVQQQIARHFNNIKGFWGKSLAESPNVLEAYKGLAQLYVDDPRYTSQNGQENPEYAAFLRQAMLHFADNQQG
ncbi:MAG TPA: MerR family transcriptional regulator, partial [Hymenobacter sp.]